MRNIVFALAVSFGLSFCASAEAQFSHPRPKFNSSDFNDAANSVDIKEVSGARSDILVRGAADCTALSDGVDGEFCVDTSRRLYECVPSAGACDTVAEWARTALATMRLAGADQGEFSDLDLASLFTVDCSTVDDRCTLTPDSKFFTEDDLTVPLTMSVLPGTGAWTITTGIITANANDIQITDDPDTDNDVTRQVWVLAKRDEAIDRTKFETKCWGYENPTNNTSYLPFIHQDDTITVHDIECLAIGGGTIDIELEECDHEGANCGTAATPDRMDESITGCNADTDTGNVDDGTIEDDDGISHAYFKLTLSGLSGDVTHLSVCMRIEYE